MNRCLIIATILYLSSLYSNFALADDTKSSALSVEIQSEQKNKVGLLNDIQAISFEAFKTEFKYTNSVDDFYRSLQRLKKNYQLDFSSNQLLSAQIDINGFKKSEIEKGRVFYSSPFPLSFFWTSLKLAPLFCFIIFPKFCMSFDFHHHCIMSCDDGKIIIGWRISVEFIND